MIILFHCGHVQEQKLCYECSDMCLQCGQDTLIQGTWRESWHVTCPRCPYHSKHGYSRDGALASAATHLAAHGHRVKPQWRTNAPPHVLKELRKIKQEKQTETLPIAPPF